MSGLSIGILVDSSLKQQYLGNMVVQAGHRIGYMYLLAEDVQPPGFDQRVDAWVVDVNTPEDHSLSERVATMVAELMETHKPVILNDGGELTLGSPEYLDWGRRTLERLERLSGDINLQRSGGASEVWVLGASTGGPAAVKDFLKALPPALNIAFLYVQHIDSGQAEPLIKMMSSAGHYPAVVARQGTVLSPNSLTLVTADRSIHIHDNGTVVLRKSGWGGCYAPSIDQVGANIARAYRQRCGIIIFSGMGDDGAASCRLIRQQGGKVWAQSPSHCTIDSMPEAALATGTVSFHGTPSELAASLARLKRM